MKFSHSTFRFRSITFSIILIFLISTFHQVRSESFAQSSKCNLTEFEDTWNAVATTGNENRHFPENFQEMTVFCRNLTDSLKKLEGFKKRHCFRNSLNTFMSIFVYSIRLHMKRNCARKPNSQSKQLVNAGSCLNQNRVLINKCERNINDNFILIQSAPNKLKIPYLCCQFVEFSDCLVSILDKTCRDRMSIVLDQFNSIMGNYRDTTCGDYTEESDKCDLLGSPRKLLHDKRTHTNAAASFKRKHSQSFILNLAEIFETIQLDSD